MLSAGPVCSCAHFLCTLRMRPRVQRAPGLPCALCLERAKSFQQTSGAMRCENAHRCHRPRKRKRTIQYSRDADDRTEKPRRTGSSASAPPRRTTVSLGLARRRSKGPFRPPQTRPPDESVMPRDGTALIRPKCHCVVPAGPGRPIQIESWPKIARRIAGCARTLPFSSARPRACV
jgi:hypothetical protein